MSIRDQNELTNKRVSFYEQWRKDYPIIFADNPDGVFPECETGWFPLIGGLLADIESILKEDAKINPRLCENDEFAQKFVIEQVKEKFGGLRFYFSCNHQCYDKIMEAVVCAEKKAKETCEVCGKQGSLCGRGWVKTLCEQHRKELGYERFERTDIF